MSRRNTAKSFFSNVRVVAEPKARQIGEKTLVEVRFVFNPGGDRYTSQFINATLSGKAGEQALTLVKGDFIDITGTVQAREYKAKDGTMRTSYEIPFADSFSAEYKDKAEAAAAPSYDMDIPL